MLALIAITFSILSQSPFEVPKTETWQLYSPSIRVDLDSMKYTEFGLDSPEAVVAYFYASRIRGDGKWQDALPPLAKRSKRVAESLDYKLEKMTHWQLKGVRLVGRQDAGVGKVAIKILFFFEDKTDFDEGEVELIDGRWYFTRPPT